MVNYFSWERFFTQTLVDATKGTAWTYSKSSINKAYLSSISINKIVKVMKNILLDTNFMFLMYVDEGNPLYLFEQLWGSHLLGFPVIIAGVLIVMYVPLVVFRIIRKKEI